MADPVDTRLRSARPSAADVDPNEVDADLLALVKRQPSGPPARRRRVAIPVAACLVAAGAAALLLGSPGGPAAPPTAAAAVRQAQEWFEPSGGILHIRSVMTSFRPGGGSDELVQETWQSVDHPERRRYLQSSNGLTSESASEGSVYDTARDTIYFEAAPGRNGRAALKRSIERKIAAAEESKIISRRDIARIRADGERALEDFEKMPADPEPTPLGDPMAAQIRKLLEQGEAELGPEKPHAGITALPITFWPNGTGPESPRWTLWTAADDGRPLELPIDNGPGTDPLQTTRWTIYELVDSAPLTLTGAHPGARIVRDPDAYEAATARLYPNG